MSEITGFDLFILIASGLIATIGSFGVYRLASGALFAGFCIVVGSQTILLSESVMWSSYGRISYFYLFLLVIYCVSACIFTVLNSRAQTFMSLILATYLTYPMFCILTGVEVGYYEEIMGAMWLAQLLISLTGVLNGFGFLDGFRRLFGNIWQSIAVRYHRRV